MDMGKSIEPLIMGGFKNPVDYIWDLHKWDLSCLKMLKHGKYYSDRKINSMVNNEFF